MAAQQRRGVAVTVVEAYVEMESSNDPGETHREGEEAS